MPPLTIESASALVVSGGASKESTMQAATGAPATLKGVVERAFYFRGKPLKKGEEVELPRIFALEMQAARKFTISKPAAAEPATPDAKPTAHRKKGEKDAGQ